MSKLDSFVNGAKMVGKGLCVLLASAAVGAAAIASAKCETNQKSDKPCYGWSTYGDAIAAISKSNMFDCHKAEAIALVQADRDPAYYAGIVSIVSSNMFDHYKVDSIKNMSR